MSKLKKWIGLFKETGSEFADDNATKLAASLAYYTIFAIGPLLLTIISLTGLFFEKEQVTGEMFLQMRRLFGKEGADQVLSIITNMQHQKSAATFSVIGFVILIFGASGVFIEIQTSINYIWSIKAKPKKGWVKYIKDRLLSFSLILGIGFLMIVSLFINTLLDLLTDRLMRMLPSESVILFRVINFALLFGIITFLFSVIYKVLPDARISWKDAIIGAAFTGILFIGGKFVISYYLSTSSISSTYGAAASVIIILTWIYYSSMILYFGAEFTKVYALNMGKGIMPYETAVFIVKGESKELPLDELKEVLNHTAQIKDDGEEPESKKETGL